jgi:hypothetical protein
VVGDGDAGLRENVARAEMKGKGWDGVLMSFASALRLASVKGYASTTPVLGRGDAASCGK